MLVEPEWDGWWSHDGSVGYDDLQPEALMTYNVVRRIQKGTSTIIVYGWSANAGIASVEVRFDDGQTRRDNVEHGVFGLMAEARDACALDVLDATGELLQQIDLASPIPPLPGSPLLVQNQAGC